MFFFLAALCVLPGAGDRPRHDQHKVRPSLHCMRAFGGKLPVRLTWRLVLLSPPPAVVRSVRRYLCGWGIIDVLASFPWQYVPGMMSSPTSNQLFLIDLFCGALKTLRVSRLLRIPSWSDLEYVRARRRFVRLASLPFSLAFRFH